jgi:hypothetical protein
MDEVDQAKGTASDGPGASSSSRFPSVRTNQRVRRAPRILQVEVRGDVVLYDPSDRSLHRLRPDAAAVWELLDGTTSTQELAREVAAAADLPEQRALEHLQHVIDALEVADLVARAESMT